MAIPAVRLCACGCGKPLTSRSALARFHPMCWVRRRLDQNRAAMQRARRSFALVDGDLPPEEIERRFALAMARIRHVRNVAPVVREGRWEIHR